MFALHTPSTAELISSQGIPTGFGGNLLVIGLLVVVAAATTAYLNDGILLSLTVAAALTFGSYLPAALFDSPRFPVRILPVIKWSLIVAGGIGTVGYLLGKGVRWMVGVK